MGCSFTQKIFTHEKIIVTNAESISQYALLFLGGLTEKLNIAIQWFRTFFHTHVQPPGVKHPVVLILTGFLGSAPI